MSATELTAHAASRPGHPAFVVPGRATRTYSELDDRSSRLAAVLRNAGLQPDDVVAVVMNNVVEFAEAVWAPLRSGLRVAPLNTHQLPAELGALLRAAKPAAILTDPSTAELAAAALDGTGVDPRVALTAGPELDAALAQADRLPDADERPGARLVYSSGTTGLPKAIREPLPEHAPGTPLPPPRLASLMARLGIGEDAVVLSPGPAYHSAPFGFMATTQRLGGTALSAAERFDPRTCLQQVEAYGVTHLHLVPTMLVRLLRLPAAERAAFAEGAGSRLRAVVLGGAPCAPQIKADAMSWLGQIVHEYYGASEGYGQTSVSPQEAMTRPGTVGRLVTGRIEVTDADGAAVPPGTIGRVWFSGTPQVTYDGDPQRTAQARDARGWSTVGDVGHVDSGGYLYLAGRDGDLVITGGVNIHPQEVEDVLVAHPGVEDAGAFGVPDDEYGELLVALVRPSELGATESVSALTTTLQAWCRERLSRHKCPRSIVVCGSIPRSPAGKLRVTDARIQYQEVLACQP